MKTKQFKLHNLCLLLLALGFMLTTGMKCKKDNLDKDGLPKATQTGANTLGFLLNGEPWYPKGMVGLSSNFGAEIILNDNNNGRFGITGYRYISDTKKRTDFGIGIIRDLNTYSVPFSLSISSKNVRIYFSDGICDMFSNDVGVTVSGQLNITKLDKTSGIMSGTFEAVLAKEGCDTIKITNGRFDTQFLK